MNANHRKVPTRFGPEARFELRPIPAAPFRALDDDPGLERLKNRLLREQLAGADPELNAPLRRAANEAAALAWTTPAPLLVFPTLFEEKARAALVQAARQEHIWERSRELLAA